MLYAVFFSRRRITNVHLIACHLNFLFPTPEICIHVLHKSNNLLSITFTALLR